MAIQTDSNKRDFYQFNPQCLTPAQPPTPSIHINSNDQRTSSDSSSFNSSYLNSPTVAGSSCSGGRTTRKKRVMWTETEVNALREGVRICGAGNWVEILRRSPNQFHPSRRPADIKDKHRTLEKQGYNFE